FLPSPLRSATTPLAGDCPLTRFTGASKVKSPRPRNTLTPSGFDPITTSSRPSPSRSAGAANDTPGAKSVGDVPAVGVSETVDVTAFDCVVERGVGAVAPDARAVVRTAGLGLVDGGAADWPAAGGET